MRKFGYSTIQTIVDRAIKEFLDDESSPEFVSFFYKGHYVEAIIEWSAERCAYYVADFAVVYSRCVMHYVVNVDYDLRIAWCI